jgi:hypothetical protein
LDGPASTDAIGPWRTLVLPAANGDKEPSVPNAAICTDGSYGRKADLRCALHLGLLCLTKR